MKSKFETGVTDNIFRNLSEKNSLYLMGLSLASNDLFFSIDTLKHYPASKSNYFFSICISILREVALLVADINKSSFKQKFSSNTNEFFENLMTELAPYTDETLVKSTLRPIRNFTFHYNLNKHHDKTHLLSMINEIKKQNDIEVGLDPDVTSPLGQRYTYADTFRADILNHYLSKEIVSKISLISVDIGSFVDSLLYDLNQEHNK